MADNGLVKIKHPDTETTVSVEKQYLDTYKSHGWVETAADSGDTGARKAVKAARAKKAATAPSTPPTTVVNAPLSGDTVSDITDTTTARP